MDNMSLYLTIALAPLVGSLLAGLFGKQIGRAGAHSVTILSVAVSTVLSAYVLWGFIDGSRSKFDENVYTWLTMGGLDFSVGFLVDSLTAMMMVVVTSVSLMVHIYTIGYMHDEETGYQRFFSYISLFTFSMLMLVMSNNFVQLFFGWEAVGLVSYLAKGGKALGWPLSPESTAAIAIPVVALGVWWSLRRLHHRLFRKH